MQRKALKKDSMKKKVTPKGTTIQKEVLKQA